MNAKRTAYVLLAMAKGHRTLDELMAATTLSKQAIMRVINDHSRKLSVQIERQTVGEVHQYTLKHWGMLDVNWLWPNEKEIAGYLNLPVLEIHPRNVMA